MTGVCDPSSPVLLSYSDNAKRKYPYTWEAIQMRDAERTWVGINTSRSNAIVRSLLDQHLIPELGDYGDIRSEVKYGQDGKSRIDFLLQGERPLYLEVKKHHLGPGWQSLIPRHRHPTGTKTSAGVDGPSGPGRLCHVVLN